jgi:hypothetical protein
LGLFDVCRLFSLSRRFACCRRADPWPSHHACRRRRAQARTALLQEVVGQIAVLRSAADESLACLTCC